MINFFKPSVPKLACAYLLCMFIKDLDISIPFLAYLWPSIWLIELPINFMDSFLESVLDASVFYLYGCGIVAVYKIYILTHPRNLQSMKLLLMCHLLLNSK